jgi:hypothetical protein
MSLAQYVVPQTTNVPSQISTNYLDFLASFTSRTILFAILIAGVFFFAKVVNSGFVFLTSIGEPAKIQAATKEFTNAFIGLVLVVSIFFIVQILNFILGTRILL